MQLLAVNNLYVEIPVILVYPFLQTILKDYSLRNKLFSTEIPTSIIRFRLKRVLHHSSKELRKRFAMAVHPSEASKRCLEPYFASQFVLIRPCISGTDLPSDATRQPVAFSFRGPPIGGRKRYDGERLIIVRSAVVV